MAHDFIYISKRDPKVKKAYNNLDSLIRELQDLIRKKFTFSYYPVGSYSRNMITYDRKSNIGFDFDINLAINDDDNEYSPKEINKTLQTNLNKIAKKYGFDYPENSTRVLTLKVKDRKNSRIIFSVDLAIVNDYIDEDGYKRQQYIRYNKKQNSYTWKDQPNDFYKLPEKIEWIKGSNLLSEVRKLYIYKKNNNNDKNLHSRSIYASTINEICQKHGYYD